MQFFKTLVARSGAIVALGLIAAPVSAQMTDTQVNRIVEALRQASKPTQPVTGLYSDWQVKPENITRWSKACSGKELSPQEFQANASAARSIVTCIVRDVLKQEAKTVGTNETAAVERVAAWWMTGDPAQFNAPGISAYVQRALKAYRTTSAPTASAEKPASSKSFYDRYMAAGRNAAQRKDEKTARLYFQRALDERPQDPSALQAMRNLASQVRQSNRNTPVLEQPTRR